MASKTTTPLKSWDESFFNTSRATLAATSLASQTLYLPAGEGKGLVIVHTTFRSPSPRIVGNNTLACIAYGVWFVYILLRFYFAHAWLLVQ